MNTKGLLTMRELLAYAKAMGEKYQIDIASPEFASATQTGGFGIHLKRRRRSIRPPREYSLTLEFQDRWCEAYYCGFAFDGRAYQVKQTEVVHANGSYTITETAGGGPYLFNPEIEYAECPALDTSSTYDPEFDYGTFIEEIITYTDILPDDLIDQAVANLANDGAAYEEAAWTWQEGDIPAVGGSYALGDVAADELSATVNSAQYRWTNTGDHPIRIQWTTDVDSYDITLDGGASSGWYDPDPTIDDSDAITSVTFEEP